MSDLDFMVPVISVGLLIGGIVGGTAIYQHATVEEQVCTVESKDRTTTENGSDARLYTDECGVLQVKDAGFRGVFNSADLYAEIEEGETYHFTTFGWRIPFLSIFPGVFEAEVAK